MNSYFKSLAAEFLPEWLKAKREGKDAAPVAVAPPQSAPPRDADGSTGKLRED